MDNLSKTCGMSERTDITWIKDTGMLMREGRFKILAPILLLVVVLVLLAASPSAAIVVLNCTDLGNGVVELSYDATQEASRVRAFALDIRVSAGIITSIGNLNPDYYIYPGSIIIDEYGEVVDWGTPVAPSSDPGALGGLGTSGMTIEMGSLYVGEANAPPPTGVLLTFTVTAECDVTVTENAACGGVILEDWTTKPIVYAPPLLGVLPPGIGLYGGGIGTTDDPYLISTAEQMNAIGANPADWDRHFELMADIDLSNFTGTSFNIIGVYVSWEDPNNKPFTGVFDGNGHTISNFTYTSTDRDSIALFGYVTGEIKDIGLIDPEVDAGTGNRVGSLVGYLLSGGTITNCYVEFGSVAGDRLVGGLVGRNYGTITNCYSAASVAGASNVGGLVGYNYEGAITNCYSTGNVSANNNVGGLVGRNRGTITNCYSASIVSGSRNVGGLVGENLGTITDCYSTGSIIGNERIGGLVGENWRGTITNCYSTGSVSGNWGVGGLVGLNDEGVNLSNCYSTGSVSGGREVGGLVGRNEAGSVSNCYSTGDVSGNWHVGGLVGINYLGNVSNCYSTGSVNGGDVVGGLVGYNNYGTITNCYSTGSVTGNWFVGGLVGSNGHGSISNCYSTGATGAVSGSWDAGGLVGYNVGGSIDGCYSTGAVSGIAELGGLVGFANGGSIDGCYSTGTVSGSANIGGLVGVSFANISNCYSTGAVSGSASYVGGLVGENLRSISNCYSTGAVSGPESVVGGLVGHTDEYGGVFSSFWDTQTSGQTTSAGGEGKTTAEMQTQSTFTDATWDFVGETANGTDDIWFIPLGDYPYLWWEGMQVPMKLTPRILNCRSYGNWVKAHLTLPEGFTVADVDSDRPAVLHSFGFESAPLYVFVNENELVEIEAAFEREAVCSLAGDWPEALTVAGFLTDGNIFLGTSTVRMITPGLKEIKELALYWLNAECDQPDWCDGIDLNGDSMVNLLDYALLLNCQVEFVRE